MCGFAGFIDNRGVDKSQAEALGKAMAGAIAHRGPDDEGVWVEAQEGVVFAHRRLSIIDLSPAGHQPMVSAHNRYVIAFNGEIYNHSELRKKLEKDGLAPSWRGHSDTETILGLIEAYGLPACLQMLVGMFAFALWDREENAVFLARDRIGEKPLYYGSHGAVSFFASELKSLRQHPAFKPEVNRDALCSYLRHNYIPAPHSIYKDIFKLEPGHYLKLATGEKPQAYWSLSDVIADRHIQSDSSDEEYLNQLEKVLKQAVGQQMQADVPLGAFLSGGVDSSLIVALMQEQSSRPVKSFSIGFDNDEFDEAPYAKAVARHIGTEHHELYVTSQQARDVIPKLPHLYDEPFADSSQIPTYLVSKIAREHVTVSLSGDAGDELFGGYNRYNWGVNIWSQLSRWPLSARHLARKVVQSVPPHRWNSAFSPLRPLLPSRLKFQNIGDKLHKLSHLFDAHSENELYFRLLSHWENPANLVHAGNERDSLFEGFARNVSDMPFAQRMMVYDMLNYLPDDILVKVDRAAMGVSLETRVPFLDHRVIETAWQMPMHLKIKDGTGKDCLRRLLYRRVPKTLIERPKMGFGVPLGDWLRGPLREWTESLINKQRLEQSGYFVPDDIQAKWTEHLSGRRNWQYHLWGILMFEAWRDEAGI